MNKSQWIPARTSKSQWIPARTPYGETNKAADVAFWAQHTQIPLPIVGKQYIPPIEAMNPSEYGWEIVRRINVACGVWE